MKIGSKSHQDVIEYTFKILFLRLLFCCGSLPPSCQQTVWSLWLQLKLSEHFCISKTSKSPESFHFLHVCISCVIQLFGKNNSPQKSKVNVSLDVECIAFPWASHILHSRVTPANINICFSFQPAVVLCSGGVWQMWPSDRILEWMREYDLASETEVGHNCGYCFSKYKMNATVHLH